MEPTLEEAKGILGTSTRISQELLRAQHPQQEVTEEPAEQMMEPQKDIAEVESNLMNEIQSLKELITERSTQDEIESIRRELQDLIQDNYGEEGESETAVESSE